MLLLFIRLTLLRAPFHFANICALLPLNRMRGRRLFCVNSVFWLLERITPTAVALASVVREPGVSRAASSKESRVAGDVPGIFFFTLRPNGSGSSILAETRHPTNLTVCMENEHLCASTHHCLSNGSRRADRSCWECSCTMKHKKLFHACAHPALINSAKIS